MASCGYRTGTITDTTRPNWHSTGPRPISWSAWYPARDTGQREAPTRRFFDMGNVVLNADLADPWKLPVVVLSHGTGGTVEGLGWLARALATEGYVVLGANHHGNTGAEPYLPEGFLCWWERAKDLSVLLTSLTSSGKFAGRLDLEQISAVGFSLGAYTVLALAGAQSSLTEFETWRNENGITAGGPKEFPDLADHIPTLAKDSVAFRNSWNRHSENFTDERIKSVVAIAPPPPIRAFTAQSLAQITRPVTILTGGADLEAPAQHCADWLVQQNPAFRRYDLGRDVGHYTFLDFPADSSLVGKVDIFTDPETVDRAKIHRQAAARVVQALA